MTPSSTAPIAAFGTRVRRGTLAAWRKAKSLSKGLFRCATAPIEAQPSSREATEQVSASAAASQARLRAAPSLARKAPSAETVQRWRCSDATSCSWSESQTTFPSGGGSASSDNTDDSSSLDLLSPRMSDASFISTAVTEIMPITATSSDLALCTCTVRVRMAPSAAKADTQAAPEADQDRSRQSPANEGNEEALDCALAQVEAKLDLVTAQRDVAVNMVCIQAQQLDQAWQERDVSHALAQLAVGVAQTASDENALLQQANLQLLCSAVAAGAEEQAVRHRLAEVEAECGAFAAAAVMAQGELQAAQEQVAALAQAYNTLLQQAATWRWDAEAAQHQLEDAQRALQSMDTQIEALHETMMNGALYEAYGVAPVAPLPRVEAEVVVMTRDTSYAAACPAAW